MSEATPGASIRHNPEHARFEFEAEGHVAVAEYELVEDVITFVHTEVPPELGGRGLGTQLVKAGLAHAREQGLKVIPSCTFFARYMQKTPETHDLLHPEHRAVAES